ncbi:MAG TPA: PRC-barrel domain-containing protein, partial [Anaerolineae bacterium]|nr:PRC-barrel domain-containing protein [Anaerolineae bacterium]
MKNIPLAAQVDCSDGPAGQSVSVIVNPATHQATYVVVEEKKHSHTKRLVPVDQITETRPDSIRLRCTLAELAQMELFAVTNYRQVEIPRYAGGEISMSPYQTPEILIIEEEQEFIPAGQRVVRRGTKVMATDGEVGQVDDLILDPTTGVVTHFVLREGHRWGQKDVIMPVSAVKSVEAEAVYLNLDQETIHAMLAIPTKQRRAAAGVELLILSLAQPDQAETALQALKAAIK